MYCYIRSHGPAGLRRIAEDAVLNANYLLARLKTTLPVPQGDRCMHEFVASAATLEEPCATSRRWKSPSGCWITASMPPTVYFPLIVREALMIEPTETESKATLDAFAEAIAQILEESPESLHEAPNTTAICRPDEVLAARKPVLKWKNEE